MNPKADSEELEKEIEDAPENTPLTEEELAEQANASLKEAFPADEEDQDEDTETDDDPKAEEQEEEPKAATPAEDDKKEENDEGSLALPDDEEVSDRTRERFHKLTERLEEANLRAATAESGIQNLKQVMDANNTTEQDLAGFLEFNRMVSSHDPSDLQAAKAMAEQQLARINGALGLPQGNDPLEGFSDLQSAVNNMEIEPEVAQELANLRRQVNRPQPTAQPQTPQPTQSPVDVGTINELNALERVWRETDIRFPEKIKHLSQEKIAEIWNKTRPEHFVEAIKEYWRSLDPAETVTRAQRNRTAQRPLGGNVSASGNSKPVYGNEAEEAMAFLKDQGLG